VALVAGGRTLDSKSMRIVMDPEARLAGADRSRWNAIALELHDAQRRGNEVQATLNRLHPQMTDVAGKIGAAANVPANVKSQFEALNRDYEAVRVKFGVPTAARGGSGRWRRRTGRRSRGPERAGSRALPERHHVDLGTHRVMRYLVRQRRRARR
jgi:hypothetical protein